MAVFNRMETALDRLHSAVQLHRGDKMNDSAHGYIHADSLHRNLVAVDDTATRVAYHGLGVKGLATLAHPVTGTAIPCDRQAPLPINLHLIEHGHITLKAY